MAAPKLFAVPASAPDVEPPIDPMAVRAARLDAALEHYAAQLPSADALAQDQDEQARALLYEDKSTYPRFLVPALDQLAGPLAPGEVWVVGAREGQGKSVFCLNLFDDLIRQDVTALYIGTEQSPHVLRVKHACLRLGENPRKVLKPTIAEQGASDYPALVQRVDDALRELLARDVRRTGIYAATPHIDRATMARWVGGGVRKYGVRVAIVDHVDHVNHGEGRNPVHELTQTIRLALRLATDLGVTVVLASQVKRAADQVGRHEPPAATDLAGTSDKERTAALILGLWRPLRDDLTPKEARALIEQAKGGRAEEASVYKPFAMGVKVLKDRLGDAPGRQTELRVGFGNRLEPAPDATHGVRTDGRTRGAV